MNTIMKNIVLSVLCLLLNSFVYGQNDYYFKQLSVRDGLSQSTVKTTFYDSRGYLWIGTRSGINRYDAHELKVYQNSPRYPNILPSNSIHFISEDKKGGLWVGTETGLAKYNYLEDSFKEVTLESGNSIWVRTSLSIPEGQLFGGHGGLYVFDDVTNKISRIQVKSNSFSGIQDAVRFLAYWKEDLYFVGTRRDGLWIYNHKTKNIERSTFCTYDNIMAYHLDLDGSLWVSPYGEGVVQYNYKGEFIKHFTTDNSSLSYNVILDIKSRDNEVWFATDGGGISIWNKNIQSFTWLNHDPGNVNSFPVNSVISLYLDLSNNMWAGSIRGGLIGIRKVFMKSFRDVVPNNAHGLSERTVLSLFESPKNVVWIGTDGGGVNKLDIHKQEFTHFPSTFSFKVVSLTRYDHNHLLLSVFSQGLFLLNEKNKKITPFNPFTEQESLELFHSGYSVNVSSINKDSILLFANKVYLYNKLKKTLSVVKTNSDGESPQTFKQIISKHGSYYYLASVKDLYCLDTEKMQLELIYTAPNKQRIQTVEEGGENTLWIGTDQGLLEFNLSSGIAELVNSDLLAEVNALAYHPQKGLWIGANGILYNYQPETSLFSIWGESSGAAYNEYLAKPSLVSQSGKIFLGGVMGLLEIDENIDLNNQSEPKLILSSIIIDGVASLAKVKDSHVAIPWNHSSLSINVLPKNDDIFRDLAYKFVLKGSNNKEFLTNKNTAYLSNLPIGKYDIQVSCTAHDGKWTPKKTILTIEVTPPWWRTNLALFIWGCLIVTTIFIYHRYNKSKRLQELAIMKRDEEQKQNEERIRFLINISHELRTPLTLIYAPLKRILEKIDTKTIFYKELVGVFRKTKQMRNILNMILDIRQMEHNDHVVSLSHLHLSTFINALIEDFIVEFKAKEITLKLQINYDGYVYLDQSKCEIILSNFLMNAYKFTATGSTVSLSVDKEDESLIFKVSDEGIGLSKEDLNRVFERFYRGSHTVKGSGIGLSYAKMLVKAFNGDIGAYNNSNQGATFWFSVPISKFQESKMETLEVEAILDNQVYSDIPTELDLLNTKLYSVAIVEDDDELRSFITKELEYYFKTVYTFCNGKDAISNLENNMPDLVISDVMMPLMDGYELCKSIKQSKAISHIPVLLLTARVDNFSEKIGYKVGADAYVPKPFDIDNLLYLIKNILYTREQVKKSTVTSDKLIDPVENTYSIGDENFISNLNKIISDNISNPNLDVNFITEEIGMSRASLYNKLKAIGGVGVNDYVISCRINYACELLKNTDKSVGEISDMLGFNNQRYFSTVFKQIKGVSPSVYRKQ